MLSASCRSARPGGVGSTASSQRGAGATRPDAFSLRCGLRGRPALLHSVENPGLGAVSPLAGAPEENRGYTTHGNTYRRFRSGTRSTVTGNGFPSRTIVNGSAAEGDSGRGAPETRHRSPHRKKEVNNTHTSLVMPLLLHVFLTNTGRGDRDRCPTP